jgi:putative ABC transport system ATP-binding protein
MAAALIALVEVTKVYPTGDTEVRALDGVSLEIEEGEYVAIMGSSGSGKSTMMNMLGCLDRPTSGTYVLAGRPVSKLGARELARVRNAFIGFVFQQFNLLPRTSALDNVALPLIYAGLGGRQRRLRATEALELVGLGARLGHHPNQLSGGQQQRVAIARAIVNHPKVVLADEPTGALDTRTSIDVMALFQTLWRTGITVVVVTHEPDIAACASRVVVMRDGRIVSDRAQEPRLAAPPSGSPHAERSP